MSGPEITRREALTLGAAALASATAPAIAIEAATAAAPAEPLLPAFVVGSPGEYDWLFVRARDDEAAIMAWLEENGREHRDYCEAEECKCKDWREARVCEHCCQPDLEADRAADFDAIESPTPGDWIRAGFGHFCSRCGYETYGEEGAQGVGDEAVCADCMRLVDWEKVDPERAREMRQELEDE